MTSVALIAGGCRSLLGIEDVEVAIDSGQPIDAGTDAPLDAFPGCYGVDPFLLCLSPDVVLNPVMILDTQTISTSTGCTFLHLVGNQPWCVIAAATVMVTGPVRAVGPNPLVLLATDALHVTSGGSIDVSSSLSALGAGADLGPCMPGTDGNVGTSAGDGGGGGAGGSFGSAGGMGGNSLSLNGGGGTPGSPSQTPTLRGGCPGTRGASSGVSSAGGGRAGGAVYLIGGSSLTIDGAIYASGGGGPGGVVPRGGGGGGGSGGMIVVWSPRIEAAAARIVANGGGGGSGGGPSISGFDGGTSIDPLLGGAGGPGGGGTGPGGTGSARGLSGSSGGDDTAGSGGGGGGGGAGVIRWLSGLVPSASNTNISPPAT